VSIFGDEMRVAVVLFNSRSFAGLVGFFFVVIASLQNQGLAQMIVAHRGSSAQAPENTLAAFRLAWEHQADAIEGDFYLSKDGQIVSLHDKTTGRTAGVDWDVRTQTLQQLRTLDVGKWKSEKFTGERIPTLEEVCQVIPSNKKLVLEIKDSARIVPVLKTKIESDPRLKALSVSRLMIISFDQQVVAQCKKQLPQVDAMWLTSFKKDSVTGSISPSIQEILETLKRVNADGLDCQAAEHIDADFVKQLRDAKYQFHVWTVDDPSVAQRFSELGVDSITTNVPAQIRQAVTGE